MQYISNLTKEQQRVLSQRLQLNIVACTEMVCSIADSYNVDRNEALDLFMYLQKKYCDNYDFNKCELRREKLAEQILKKLLNK